MNPFNDFPKHTPDGRNVPFRGSPILQPGSPIPMGFYLGGSAASPASGSQVYNTPGTYNFTVPSGVTRLLASAIAAGGGSGGAQVPSSGGNYGGSGGGGGAESGFLDVTPGTVLTINVGTGGLAGTSTTNGTTGGSSSIANGVTVLLSATGGTFGTFATPAGGFTNGTGGTGGGHTGMNSFSGGTNTPNGGNSAGSAQSASASLAGIGFGTLPAGGFGGASVANYNGYPGVQPGGGAGAGYTSKTYNLPVNGGTGANGEVVLIW
jgi:hypothetical protein